MTKVPSRKGPKKATKVHNCAQIAESGVKPPFESPHLDFPNCLSNSFARTDYSRLRIAARLSALVGSLFSVWERVGTGKSHPWTNVSVGGNFRRTFRTIGPYEFPQEKVWTNDGQSSLKVSVLTGIGP